MMEKGLHDLVEISQFYGKQKEFVIAGGGNTSWKTDELLYIKASGVSLATIGADGFAVLDREKLAQIETMELSSDHVIREEQVKNALLNCRIHPESGLRPSVETSLHNLFSYSFVVHTHPTLVNALMCSNNAEAKTLELFGSNVLYIPYVDPGYVLFIEIKKKADAFRKQSGYDPQVVFIQNHGIFVAANSTEEIKKIYSEIFSQLEKSITQLPKLTPLPVSDKIIKIIPAIRMLFSGNEIKLARAFNYPVLQQVTADKPAFSKIAKPFSPDQMVYCHSEYLYIENTGTGAAILEEIRQKTDDYINRKGTTPKVIFIKNEGAVIIDNNAQALDYLHDLVLDFTQIAVLSENFGGPHPMTPAQISFIENWEVEHYRKKVSIGGKAKRRAEGKVVVITGAAQGFGAGIAELMFNEGANVVIADLNREKGAAFAQSLNEKGKNNRAFFQPVDVADADSVKQLVQNSVAHFGGIDVMISNAGILRAGSLEEMTPETFELMTRVNYNAYFYCTKYAGEVMKLQHQFKPDYFMDIIQINSKSGLKGSNKNFAYAGGKFGGIGLTQSFALELMPFKIKVNAVCPGNFFDGPLWSDPENGLFVQYLDAGKIPGAKTVEDVKKHYESQVPAGRGCTSTDVVKAIYYIMEQEYETGQAIPVTGGQEMLN